MNNIMDCLSKKSIGVAEQLVVSEFLTTAKEQGDFEWGDRDYGVLIFTDGEAFGYGLRVDEKYLSANTLGEAFCDQVLEVGRRAIGLYVDSFPELKTFSDGCDGVIEDVASWLNINNGLPNGDERGLILCSFAAAVLSKYRENVLLDHNNRVMVVVLDL